MQMEHPRPLELPSSCDDWRYAAARLVASIGLVAAFRRQSVIGDQQRLPDSLEHARCSEVRCLPGRFSSPRSSRAHIPSSVSTPSPPLQRSKPSPPSTPSSPEPRGARRLRHHPDRVVAAPARGVVVPRTAGHEVVAVGRQECVVPLVAVERFSTLVLAERTEQIVARASVHVVACPASQHVGVLAPEERVRSLFTDHGVRARPALKNVRARPTADQVRATESVDDVVAPATVDHVRPLGPGDRVAVVRSRDRGGQVEAVPSDRSAPKPSRD